MDPHPFYKETDRDYETKLKGWITTSVRFFVLGEKKFAKSNLLHMIEHYQYKNNKRLLIELIERCFNEEIANILSQYATLLSNRFLFLIRDMLKTVTVSADQTPVEITDAEFERILKEIVSKSIIWFVFDEEENILPNITIFLALYRDKIDKNSLLDFIEKNVDNIILFHLKTDILITKANYIHFATRTVNLVPGLTSDFPSSPTFRLNELVQTMESLHKRITSMEKSQDALHQARQNK